MNRADRQQKLACRELQREADSIGSLIVASDYPAIDIVIQIGRLKEFVEAQFPDRVWLFELIYGSRFRRLWEQFRPEGQGALPDW